MPKNQSETKGASKDSYLLFSFFLLRWSSQTVFFKGGRTIFFVHSLQFLENLLLRSLFFVSTCCTARYYYRIHVLNIGRFSHFMTAALFFWQMFLKMPVGMHSFLWIFFSTRMSYCNEYIFANQNFFQRPTSHLSL